MPTSILLTGVGSANAAGSSGRDEIQQYLIGGLDTYVNGAGLTLHPALSGFGPFNAISLDDGADFIVAPELALAVQTELATDEDLDGKVGVAGSYVNSDTANGLKCFLRFSDLDASPGGDTAADSTGEGNGGVISATGATRAANPFTAIGDAVYALDVDGSTPGKAVIAHAAEIDFVNNEPFSYEIWIYPHAGANYSTWFSRTLDGFSFIEMRFFSTTRQPEFVFYNKTCRSADAVSLNAASHIVTTFDGTDFRIYVNGVLKATTAVSGIAGGSTAIATDITLGCRTNGTVPFDGLLGGFKIYDRCLSDAEVALRSLGGDQIKLLATFTGLGNVSEMTFDDSVLGVKEQVTIEAANPDDVTTDTYDNSVALDESEQFLSQTPGAGWAVDPGTSPGNPGVFERETDGNVTDATKASGDGTVSVTRQGAGPLTVMTSTVQEGA